MATKFYYYDKIMKRYRVQKRQGPRCTSYGTYGSEEEAQLVVEELEKVDWDKKELQNIKDKLNIKSVRRLRLDK